MTLPPCAAPALGVSDLFGQGDGRGERPGPASPSGGELIGMGVAIAVSLVLPLAAGVGVDALLHSSPAGFLVGLLIGIVTAAAFTVAQFRRYL